MIMMCFHSDGFVAMKLKKASNVSNLRIVERVSSLTGVGVGAGWGRRNRDLTNVCGVWGARVKFHEKCALPSNSQQFSTVIENGSRVVNVFETKSCNQLSLVMCVVGLEYDI